MTYEEAAQKPLSVFYNIGHILGKTRNVIRVAATLGKVSTTEVWAIPTKCITDIIPLGELEIDYED